VIFETDVFGWEGSNVFVYDGNEFGKDMLVMKTNGGYMDSLDVLDSYNTLGFVVVSMTLRHELDWDVLCL